MLQHFPIPFTLIYLDCQLKIIPGFASMQQMNGQHITAIVFVPEYGFLAY